MHMIAYDAFYTKTEHFSPKKKEESRKIFLFAFSSENERKILNSLFWIKAQILFSLSETNAETKSFCFLLGSFIGMPLFSVVFLAKTEIQLALFKK